VFGNDSLNETEYYYRGCPDGIPDHFDNRTLRTYYEEPVYIPVTEADRVRDPELWNGFRFSDADFEYLETEPGINKVQSNGGYTLYRVEPADNAARTNPVEQCYPV